MAAEDNFLDRIGKSIIAVAIRHKIRGLPHRGVGASHGDAKAAPFEHRDVVATVTDDGDLCQRNRQQLCELRERDALVRQRIGDVEVLGL